VLAASAPGREFEVRPRTLVLAAGGIENARLLLISDADDRRGPANLHGTVGRHFTEHVYVDGGTFVPAKPDSLGFYFARSTGADENRRTARGAWSPTRALMREHGLLNSAIFFRPAYESDPAFGDARVQSMLAVWDMLRSRAVPHRLVRRALHAATAPHVVGAALWRRMRERSDTVPSWRLRALCECSTDADNRVELAGERDSLGRPIARLRWRIRDAEVRSIRRTHELLDEALRRAGSGHIELPAADAWRACMEPGLHHLGTTRMHLDPTQGVVDADSRVHGLDNFYVAGGSVFPTGGYANPTLTILATTLRLAAHLGSRRS
jgi:choline dehydrogenase-like flavoprotein